MGDIYPLSIQAGLTLGLFYLQVFCIYFFRFKELDRLGWHNGRYSVFINELRMRISAQQHAEIIKPCNYTLKFNAVNEKYGDWHFSFSN